MHDLPQRLKRALREVASAAYQEELRRALVPLAAAFDASRVAVRWQPRSPRSRHLTGRTI